jgi:hypothetical protein
MGLEKPPRITLQQQRRCALTVIRRNWHLLPYDQLLLLLGWSAEELAFTLREDDFLFIKLGSLKPDAPPLRWAPPTPAQQQHARRIAELVRQEFPHGQLAGRDPLFSFVERLSAKPGRPLAPPAPSNSSGRPLRMCYSYFALYGDPLLHPELDPYPDGYLARLAQAGVTAVWLQGVLSQLAPLPWQPDAHIEQRRRSLAQLARRARAHGIDVFLYLNEPRAKPVEAFGPHAAWRGVVEGGFATVCTSVPEVRAALGSAVARLCEAVPELGGFFTITGSENLTHCWSHGGGRACPRCGQRRPAEVTAEVNATFAEGIRQVAKGQRLIAWDWGWADAWHEEAIGLLPPGTWLMSVSEWSMPIERGGVKSHVGEYCMSVVGPGPRARRAWTAARKRGLPVAAKIQAANTWELSALPYLPVLDNVAQHALNLRQEGVDNIMLGWTLGGYPSPNLDLVAEVQQGGTLESFARRRHGPAADVALAFWRDCSAAFREFPFSDATVYNAPFQLGPANPLWARPTGYHATMVGFPYDDLAAWRSIYPAEVWVKQLEKVVDGFEAGLGRLRTAMPKLPSALAEEAAYAEAATLHWGSAANQARFILARSTGSAEEMRRIAAREAELAKRLHALQSADARIGFEASNQYYYVPLDLVEKMILCRQLG